MGTSESIDWFNRRRLRSRVGYRPLIEVEKGFKIRTTPNITAMERV